MKCVQHLEEVEPWVDELSQRLHHVSSIDRHRKYLLCLQHIEELRYVGVSGKRITLANPKSKSNVKLPSSASGSLFQ